jgi:hypothetical protein
MSIDNENGPSVGASKLEDISKLIQIYMVFPTSFRWEWKVWNPVKINVISILAKN